MDATQLAQRLNAMNDRLATSFRRLASAADDPEIARHRQVLREFGRQVNYADTLLQQDKVDEAEQAMPDRLTVKEACRQADEIFVFGDDAPDQSGTSEPEPTQTKESPDSDTVQPIPVVGRHRRESDEEDFEQTQPVPSPQGENQPSNAEILAAVRENALSKDQRQLVGDFDEQLRRHSLAPADVVKAAVFITEHRDQLEQLVTAKTTNSDDQTGTAETVKDKAQGFLDDFFAKRRRPPKASDTTDNYPYRGANASDS